MAKMQTPDNAVTVRMYRQGHGDCFLLAFPRSGSGDPVYVLIDCGYKPGSQKFIHGRSIADTVDHIAESTGRHLDLVVITHEHQDHVNGFWKKNDPYFGAFTIDEAWLAWTEDPADDLANELRQRHRDQLLGLIEARQQLASALGAGDASLTRLDALLSLEVGGEDDAFDPAAFHAAADPAKSQNKQSMKLVKDKAAAGNGIRYFSPGGGRQLLPGTSGYGAYVLGPPRDEDLLKDEDPVGNEAFPESGQANHGLSFMAAVQADDQDRAAPFDRRYRVPLEMASFYPHFHAHYGKGESEADVGEPTQVPDDAPWRRVDSEWLYAAENLALKLNSGINNTSLVLAFELPMSRKVLLFAADAQRGNWRSWDDQSFLDDNQEITTRDLLARTVLYKVGHHGSHNATLAGKPDDDYPNLSWMAQGPAAAEFTAMITAVNQWALEKNNPPWRHPLPSIRQALLHKTQGRLFQTDTPPGEFSVDFAPAAQADFTARTITDELFYELVIKDE